MIVVTGSLGVIGSVMMDRLRSERIEAIGVHRKAFNLASGASLAKFINRRPKAIIHLAAAVPHSTHYPDNENSAALTRAIDYTVRDAAIEWNCRLVYASTCSLYDKYTSSVKCENTPIAIGQDSPYLLAKYDGEKIFSALPSHAILRLPAPIGPGLPDNVVAKLFFNQALAGQTIRVWGNGKREQNYVNIFDISDIFLRAAYSKSQGVFNVSADKPTTMLNLAEMMVRVIPGASFQFAGIPDPLEFEYTRYSNTRSRDLLGWSPVTSLEKSILYMYKAIK